jgi:hypothetical protein
MATDKARQNLQNYHEFANRSVDRPFLTPESVSEHE